MEASFLVAQYVLQPPFLDTQEFSLLSLPKLCKANQAITMRCIYFLPPISFNIRLLNVSFGPLGTGGYGKFSFLLSKHSVRGLYPDSKPVFSKRLKLCCGWYKSPGEDGHVHLAHGVKPVVAAPSLWP